MLERATDSGQNQNFDKHAMQAALHSLDFEKTWPKITDPEKIAAIQKKANELFILFLRKRARKIEKIHNVNFEMSFDNMSRELNLSDLEPRMAQTIMKQIVLSDPSMYETKTGYKVKNEILLIENYGLKAVENKILKALGSGNAYSLRDLEAKLGIPYFTIQTTMTKLELQNKVTRLSEKKPTGKNHNSSSEFMFTVIQNEENK